METLLKGLVISLTVNVLSVLFIVLQRCLKKIISKIPHEAAKVTEERVVGEEARLKAARTSRLILTQSVSFSTAGLATFILFASSLLQTPFKIPSWHSDQNPIWILASLNTGKYATMIGWSLFSRERAHKNFSQTLIAYVIAFALLNTFLFVEENAILVVIGAVMDAQPCVTLIRKCVMIVSAILKLSVHHVDSISDVINVTSGFIFRIAIPLSMLAFSFTKQSVMDLSPMSLASLCISIGFFGVLSIWRWLELVHALIVTCHSKTDPRVPCDIPYNIVAGFLIHKQSNNIEKSSKGVAQEIMKNKSNKFAPRLDTITE